MAKIIEDFSQLTALELAEAPKISFQQKSMNLGVIDLKLNRTIVFDFENKGKQDLMIHRIQLNNDKFKISEYDKIVKPGNTSAIKFTLKENRGKSLNSSFIVISNDPHNSETILQILGSLSSEEKDQQKMEIVTEDVKNIDLQEALNLIEKYDGSEKLVLLDVRTSAEYKEGYIHGALNLDPEEPDFKRFLSILDKSRLYIVYCSFGKRSHETIILMNKLGFENVLHFADGYEGWVQKRLPVEK